MYDHDLEDIEVLGWEEFVLRLWESVYTSYRSGAGRRKVCRRWSDLIEAGLSCSQEIADSLVRAEIMDRADRDLEAVADPTELLAAMTDVLVGLRLDLEQMSEIPADQLPGLLEQHARLLAQLRP